MTARNVQEEAKTKGLPWSIAKGFDTFLPVSDFVPKSSLRDPHSVQLSLAVNDQIRQDASTQLMLFRIPRLLSDISQVMTLEQGDVVLTGTPKGVGSVTVGDRMRAELKDGEHSVAHIDVGVDEKGGPYEFRET